MTWLGWLGLIGVFGGLFYWAVAAVALRVWMDEPAAGPVATGPVSFLRPIKRGSPRLRELLELHAAALRAEDELILGLDDDATAAAGAEIAARWPERRIVVVRCVANERGNPKLAKLAELAARARHADWILCDSELRCDAAFAEALRREWADSGADVLTCGYRFDGAQTWPQRLDAAAVLGTLWPGLAVLRLFSRPRFALGACTAVRGADVAAIGGFAALRAELADDHALGARLAAAGKTLRLARTIATLACDDLSWRDWWRHQRRVAVTYRACAPLGYAGQLFTHGIPWAVLLALSVDWPRQREWVWAWGVVVAGVALAAGNARRLGFRLPGLFLSIPLAALAESVCWALSWVSRGVWWGGRWRGITWRGRLRD